MSTNCQVCEAHPAKYKCPACSTQSCSLDCTKLHKEVCAGPPEPPNPPTGPSPTTTAITTSQTTNTTPTTRQTPLLKLASSPSLTAILTKSPSLRSSLHEIYLLTLEPEPNTPHHAKYIAHFTNNNSRGRNRHRGRGGRIQKRWNNERPPPWTPERGMKLALAELRARFLRKEIGGENVEAVRAFAALVERLDGEEGIDGAVAKS